MVLASFIALVALPFAVLAAPARSPFRGSSRGRRPISCLAHASVFPLPNIANCPVSSDVLSLPSGLSIPDGQAPVNIALGVGVQNYTCTDGKYTYVVSDALSHESVLLNFYRRSAGAVAELYDISCLYDTPAFATVQDDFFRLPSFLKNTIQNIAERTRLFLGHHYFITNPLTGTGISPKFAQAKDGGAVFTILAKDAGVSAPSGPENVDFLQLSSIDGTWAKSVFRVDTKAGQPPATCTSGTLSVPYTAKYCECPCWPILPQAYNYYRVLLRLAVSALSW